MRSRAETESPSRQHICAIIITFNTEEGIEPVMTAVSGQVAHMLIVDNHSNDATLECIQRLKKRYQNSMTVVLNSENKGIAAALNQGVCFALDRGYKWVLTLDHDSVPRTNMVEVMIKVYEQVPCKDQIGIVAPQSLDNVTLQKFGNSVLCAEDNETNYGGLAGRFQYVDVIHTSGNLVSAALIRELGYFREDFFIDQVDYEFCFRLRRSGYQIIVVTDAYLEHKLGNMKRVKFFGRTIVCTNHSAIRTYYINRNRIILFLATKDLRFIKRQSASAVKEFIKVLLFEDDKIAKLMMSIRGVIDGLRGRLGQY